MAGQLTSEVDTKAEHRQSVLADEVLGYYRTLLQRLHWPPTVNDLDDHNISEHLPALCCVGITSSCRYEGVSTVAWQLAAAAAEMDERSVLLVDANLAHPAVHKTFRIKNSPGLAEALLDPKTLEASVRSVDGRNLSVLTAGNTTERALKVLGSTAIDEVVEILRRHYDLVIFDMPPADEQCTALRLAEMTDGMLMVIESQRVSWEVARRSTQLLRFSGARTLGAVLNKR